jgi:hypothetical protein
MVRNVANSLFLGVISLQVNAKRRHIELGRDKFLELPNRHIRVDIHFDKSRSLLHLANQIL